MTRKAKEQRSPFAGAISGSGARVVHPKEVTAKRSCGPLSVRRHWYRAAGGHARTDVDGRRAVDLPYDSRSFCSL